MNFDFWWIWAFIFGHIFHEIKLGEFIGSENVILTISEAQKFNFSEFLQILGGFNFPKLIFSAITKWSNGNFELVISQKLVSRKIRVW